MARQNNYIDEISKHIGKQIKLLRITHGFSRQQLANNIGVTQQQLVKYEAGTNRLSFGRLVLIAKALSVNLSYFYQDLEKFNQVPDVSQHQRMCIQVARNFMQIENSEHKAAINDLVKTLSKAA